MSNIRIRLTDIHQVDALDDAIDFILTSKPLPQGMSVEHLSKIQKQLNSIQEKYDAAEERKRKAAYRIPELHTSVPVQPLEL